MILMKWHGWRHKREQLPDDTLYEDRIGAPSGVAGLDEDAQIPIEQLPPAVVGNLKYKGNFDASGGVGPSPTEVGWWWDITGAGTIDDVDYEIGDYIICIGIEPSVFSKIDNTDKVTSVNDLTGAVIIAKTIYRSIHVQKGGDDDNTGSEQYPFATVPAAIVAAKALVMVPSTANPIAILIGPGVYSEQVVLDHEGISLYGYGQGITSFERAGTALRIRDNGVDPEPWDVKIVGISIRSTNAAEYGTTVEGVAGTSLGGNEIQFRDSRLWGTKAIHANIANYIDMQNTYVMGEQLYEQTSGIWLEDSESAATIVVDWDPAGTKPSDPDHYGINFVRHLPRGAITLLHDGAIGEDLRPRAIGTTSGTVVEGDKAALLAGRIGGQVINGGSTDGAELTLRGSSSDGGVVATEGSLEVRGGFSQAAGEEHNLGGNRCQGMADAEDDTDGANKSYVDGAIVDHTAIASAHHSRYTDGEAVDAMGVKGDSNPLNHDRYTDEDAVAACSGAYIPTSEKGAPGGVATIDVNGHVPTSQVGNLPIIAEISETNGDDDTADGTPLHAYATVQAAVDDGHQMIRLDASCNTYQNVTIPASMYVTIIGNEGRGEILGLGTLTLGQYSHAECIGLYIDDIADDFGTGTATLVLYNCELGGPQAATLINAISLGIAICDYTNNFNEFDGLFWTSSAELLLGTNSKQIKNVSDPTDAQDAATKNYTDLPFDTTTGHDHDGINSKTVSYNDLTDIPTIFPGSSEAEQTNATEVWAQAYRFSPTLVVAKYLVMYQWEMTQTQSSKTAEAKLEIDDTTEIVYTALTPPVADEYCVRSGHYIYNCTGAGAHNFDIDFRELGGGMAKIRRMRLTLMKVVE